MDGAALIPLLTVVGCMTTFFYKLTPVGWLKIETAEARLTGLHILKDKPNAVELDPQTDFEHRVSKWLDDFFAGSNHMNELPLFLKGTDFQQSVWQALCDIPLGETVCYQDIANSIGKPKATRAVGTAIGKNPVAIIVPCHRVIAKDGSLGGFASGLDAKKVLLRAEGHKL